MGIVVACGIVIGNSSAAWAALPPDCLNQVLQKSQQGIDATTKAINEKQSRIENWISRIERAQNEIVLYWKGAWVEECLAAAPANRTRFQTFYKEKGTPMLEQAEAKLKELKGDSGFAAPDEKKRAFKFRQEFIKRAGGIHTLAPLLTEPERDVISNWTPESFPKLLEGMKEIEDGCNGPYQGIRNIPGYSVNIDSSPGSWCEVARRRVELTQAAIKNRIAKEIEMQLGRLGDVANGLEKQEGWLSLGIEPIVDPDTYKQKFRDRYQGWWKLLGKGEPADLFAGFDKRVKEVWAAIDALAPKLSFTKGAGNDGRVEKLARDTLAKDKGLKVLKTTLISQDYTIEKNGLGVPLRRYRGGAVLYKMAKDKWCRERHFTYEEIHAGGGKYQSSSSVTFFEKFRFLDCK
jgi:hypothetical protein